VYNDRPNLFSQALEKLAKFTDFSYSLGFTVAADGKLDDVIVGSPAYQAGVDQDEAHRCKRQEMDACCSALPRCSGDEQWTTPRSAWWKMPGSSRPIQCLITMATGIRIWSGFSAAGSFGMKY